MAPLPAVTHQRMAAGRAARACLCRRVARRAAKDHVSVVLRLGQADGHGKRKRRNGKSLHHSFFPPWLFTFTSARPLPRDCEGLSLDQFVAPVCDIFATDPSKLSGERQQKNGAASVRRPAELRTKTVWIRFNHSRRLCPPANLINSKLGAIVCPRHSDSVRISRTQSFAAGEWPDRRIFVCSTASAA